MPPPTDHVPRPEKEVLEERVRPLVGRTLDQVWYREIDAPGPEEKRRAMDLPLWKRGDGYEQVFMSLYLVAGETTFRLGNGGATRMAGLDVTAHPEVLLDAFDAEYELRDVSEISAWKRFVGRRITEARLFWHWTDYGIGYWECPRSLALTLEGGDAAYVTTGKLGGAGHELEGLGAVFDEEAARAHRIGPHFAPQAPPDDAVRIPPEAPAAWVVDALRAGSLEGETIRQVWSGKAPPRRERASSRWHEQAAPDVPLGYEVIRRRLYFATEEHVYYFTWGMEPQHGVYAGRGYGDSANLEDLSEASGWKRLVGNRVSGVRCFWRNHTRGERTVCIPRDLEIAMEDGYCLYLSAANPGREEEDIDHMNALTAYHGERAAWQFQIGPFADGAFPGRPP